MKANSTKNISPVIAEDKENLVLQHKAAQDLRKTIEDSENKYNTMLQQSPFAFAILKGKDMVVAMANDSIKQMWGKGNNVEGKTLIEILPEIKDQEFPALLHKVYTTGIPYVTNESLARVIRNDKIEEVYFNFSYQPFRENDGSISGVVIFATEVTEQVIAKKTLEAQYEKEKKALKLVEETNKRYYNILIESPFAFSVMKGKNMVVTLANDLIKDFWGKGNKVEGKTLLQILPELKDQPFPAMLDKVYTTGIPVYANEILAKLKRHNIMEDRYFNIFYQPDYDDNRTITGVITLAYDVTEMVLARKKIEESEKKFEAAIQAVQGIMWTNDVHGEMIGEQPGWAKLTGQILEEYQGYGWVKALHPDDVKPTLAAWNNAVENKSIFEFEHRVKTKQGDWKLFSIKAIPVFDKNDSILQWVGVHTDITQQREAEQKTRETELEVRKIKEQLELSIKAGKIGVWHWDVQNDILFWSDEQKEMYGLEPAEQISNAAQFQPYVLLEDWDRIISNAQGPKIKLDQEYEFRIKRKNDGEIRWIKSRSKIILDEIGNLKFISGVNIDVTAQVYALNKIEESKKQLALDLADAKKLQTISTQLIHEENIDQLYEQLLDAAMALMQSDMSSIQLYHPEKKELQLLAHKGLHPELVTQWQWISTDSKSVCSTAMNNGKRFIVPDLEKEELIAKSGSLHYYELSGIRAVQSTPLISRNGDLVGMLSTHWRKPHQPSERALRLFDVLARQAADLIERKKTEEKIKESEHRFHEFIYSSPSLIAIYKGEDLIIEIVNDAALESWGKGKEVIGKPLITVMPEVKEQGLDKLMLEVYNTGIPYYAYETPITIIKNGKPELMHYTYIFQAHHNANGEISGVAVIANEVTRQVILNNQIKASDERFKSLVMQAPVAICVLRGKDYIIENMNLAMGDIWDKTLAQSLNKPVFDLFPELSNHGIKALLDKVFYTGERYIVEELPVTFMRKGLLEKVFVKFVYEPMFEADGSISGIMAVAHEITEQVLARKKVEESETIFRLALFLTAKTAFKQDEQLRYTWIYNTHPKFVAKDIIGKTDSDLINNRAAEILTTIKQSVLQTGETFTGDVTIEIDGKAMVFSMNIEATKDISGKINGIIAVTDDITERKESENKIKESESRFRNMADASPVFVWTIAADGKSNYYNKTLLEFIGVSKFEDINDWSKILHPDDYQISLDTISKAIETQCAFSLECRLLRADGQWRNLLAQGNPRVGENSEFLGFVGSSIDITDHKQAAEKLIQAKESAENLAKSKQQFLANMSHEIRTPLNTILGFTNVLLKSELRTNQKEFVQAIKTSGKSLNVLINDILDLAKVDAGKMTFEKKPFEIIKTIQFVLHSFNLKIREKNLEQTENFDNEIPYMVLGDSVRLNQIFLNILSNAVKFTDKGKIEVSAKLLSEDQEKVTLEFAISDTGIGIAPHKIDSVFNLFEQAESGTSNSYGGTGLGLAIVKQLIEEQGGSISLKSKLGEGSTFSFILPFGKTNIKLGLETEDLLLDSEIQNLRVLVAEDVALNQLLIKIILDDFGFENEIVGNGKLAIEKMQTGAYDIILMDLQMPEMNGYEATDYLRNTMKSQIPIIALTADVTTMDVTKCKDFGMDDYISKPIDEKLLYNKIVEMVKRK